MNLSRMMNTCLAALLAHTLGCAPVDENDEAEMDVAVEGQSQALTVADAGYPSKPRGWFDVNGDGRADYCRFVGDAPFYFISCKLEGNSNEYAWNSLTGIDAGYSTRPRGFEDYNGDGRIDYCRWVGNSPNIVRRCVPGTSNGFDTNQYVNPAAPSPPPPPPPSLFAWYTVSCACSSEGSISKNICIANDSNSNEWKAIGPCQQWCMRNGWGTYVNPTAVGPQGTCSQDGGNAFL